ncbi:hypothetical protein L596_017119 [Steinernema carpocapsae]|uniref:Uncharacterized protein n=1 Tax=Steinernema carpocapsae TaxID=34508 RepID=A0A4U5N0Y1_STECR|nr:hypothetical protein L596_017119 [Steinernema carpocapsae]
MIRFKYWIGLQNGAGVGHFDRRSSRGPIGNSKRTARLLHSPRNVWPDSLSDTKVIFNFSKNLERLEFLPKPLKQNANLSVRL